MTAPPPLSEAEVHAALDAAEKIAGNKADGKFGPLVGSACAPLNAHLDIWKLTKVVLIP
jgi:hypothetical protein